MDIGGKLNVGGMYSLTSSKVEQKKLTPHWLANVPEQDLLSNKKQAMQSADHRPVPGSFHMNMSHWNNGSGYGSASGQSSNHSSVPEHNRALRELNSYPQNDLSACLHPNYWNAGASRLWDGRIPGAESGFPIMGLPYNREEGSTKTMTATSQMSDNRISLGPSFYTGIERAYPIGLNATSAHQSINSIVPTYCNGAGRGFLSMGQAAGQFGGNILQMQHPYEIRNSGVMSFHPATIYDLRASSSASGGHILQRLNASGYGSYVQQFGHGFGNPEGVAMSTLGLQNKPKDTNALAEHSELPGEKNSSEHSANQTEAAAKGKAAKADGAPKRNVGKAGKKNSSNNFPANVRSLLSTGIYDGVPVKYVSWSREKSLRGIIKGRGYLCGCDDCKMTKNLNAFEFEKHAGCKTKHPNNHIYFLNGKTIYSLVQELKGTQREMLFDAIKNSTGTPINIKNFRTWKNSYLAASRELQRIYGEDGAAAAS